MNEGGTIKIPYSRQKILAMLNLPENTRLLTVNHNYDTDTLEFYVRNPKFPGPRFDGEQVEQLSPELYWWNYAQRP